jgi:hypothetical protein
MHINDELNYWTKFSNFVCTEVLKNEEYLLWDIKMFEQCRGWTDEKFL